MGEYIFSKDRIDRPGNRPLYGMVAENHNDYWKYYFGCGIGVLVPGTYGVMHCTDDFLDPASCRGCCHRICLCIPV